MQVHFGEAAPNPSKLVEDLPLQGSVRIVDIDRYVDIQQIGGPIGSVLNRGIGKRIAAALKGFTSIGSELKRSGDKRQGDQR